MASELNGKRVAALVAKGFEQVELEEPVRALRDAGARVDIVSPEGGTVRGWNHTEWGREFGVDRTLDEATPDDTTPCSCPAAS